MAKRFYKDASVNQRDNGYAVTLDGRVLKTPGKHDLIFTSQSRAEQVALEWGAQEGDIKPETMPCTRLMNVACELTPGHRPELCKEFRMYCQTELLCFRSSTPQDLYDRQENIWQPVLNWAAKQHGVALGVTTGIQALPQPESSLSAAFEYARALDHTPLTLLLHFTASFGSGILALALMEGFLDVDAAFNASKLDEVFQNERWGTDEEAVQNRENMHKELRALAKLI